MNFRANPFRILAAVIIIAGAIYFLVGNTPAQVVAVGDTIKVDYSGTFTNGTQFDSSIGRQPLQFTVGAGQMIKGFDQAVIGMKLNETKTVTIPSVEAYGERNASLVVAIPRTNFRNQTVQIGMFVRSSYNGQAFQGVITGANATTATVDFNPPLAGKTLIFKIKILAIQKAASHS